MIIVPALSDPVPISAKDSAAKKSNTRHDHSGPAANGELPLPSLKFIQGRYLIHNTHHEKIIYLATRKYPKSII